MSRADPAAAVDVPRRTINAIERHDISFDPAEQFQYLIEDVSDLV
ncbi:hypothetical protein ACFQDG_09515 [Natronoarchaeum mannanilyticum]